MARVLEWDSVYVFTLFSIHSVYLERARVTGNLEAFKVHPFQAPVAFHDLDIRMA